MPKAPSSFTERLVAAGLVTEEQLAEARARAGGAAGPKEIGLALYQLGYLGEEEVVREFAQQYQLEAVNLDQLSIPEAVVELLPETIARKHEVVPLARGDGRVTVASFAPLDFDVLDSLRFVLNADVEVALAPLSAIRRAMDRFYGRAPAGEAMGALSALGDTAQPSETQTFVAGEEMGAEDAPVVRYVNKLIADALRVRSTDIHIEPFETRLRIRYRVDGMCVEIENPPKRLQNAIISRVKLMSGMDIAEKRMPQDGRIRLRTLGRDLDLRVSAVPSRHGESIAMRILERESIKIGLEALGFHSSDQRRFQQIIARPNGIFLVTGPTGSGKTTTLYCALQALNRPDRKIITAEDPIEYHISGINQVQVHEEINLTFASILRAMLRQAPEIILVGECRDPETAHIAIQAALTGHLVFSTLHTNDAPSAVPRLIDMGVPPYLVASSIQAVMAQRLVRKICTECKEAYEPDPALIRSAGVSDADRERITFYRGAGCGRCSQTGYYGRIGIFELVEMNATIRQMAHDQEPLPVLREECRRSGGMVTLREDALRKVEAGITTLDEVVRVTQAEVEAEMLEGFAR
jgi:type IV pilus assembly protein PilB